MEPCEFCQIVAGERDAYVLCESERAVAFLDANPATRGHTLVVPTAHHERLFTDDGSAPGDVLRLVERVVSALDETLGSNGVSLFYTSGDLVGTVTHAHVHVIPRYTDDGIDLTVARDDLDDVDAERLVDGLRERF